MPAKPGSLSRLDQAHVAPGVPVIVRPPVADGGVLLQPAYAAVALPDRLRPEGVDAAAAARDERHEPVLVVVDGEGDTGAVPALSTVRRAERHQIVDLALGTAVVAAALRGVVIGAVGREHQQIIATGRDRGTGLEQRPRRAVDHLPLHSGHREQPDFLQRPQTAGRGADADPRPMNRDPVCQRQRLVRHRDMWPAVAPRGSPPDTIIPVAAVPGSWRTRRRSTRAPRRSGRQPSGPTAPGAPAPPCGRPPWRTGSADGTGSRTAG